MTYWVKHAEYGVLDKRLCWSLLRLPAHMVSPLAPMPRYMAGLASGRDWGLPIQW